MREAVRFSCRDTLHKTPEACVTHWKQRAYVYIVHTCRVASFSACERQISMFELEINSARSKNVHFILVLFCKTMNS